MDSTKRSKEKAHEKVKLKPYGMSSKKGLVMPNEGGVPVEEVKRQQGVQIKREYIIPYTSQEGEVIRLKFDDLGLLVTQDRSQHCCRSWSAGCSCCGQVATCQAECTNKWWLFSQGYYPIRSASTVVGYLGVSVDGGMPICSYEISFMDMDVHQWSSDAWWSATL
eukprot:Gb_02618 [translate_table: standard]